MDQFARIPHISHAELCRANAVRLYLRVITIADLTDVGGHFIPAGMLTGDWQAGSDLQWPYQPLPPKNFWGTFCSCLRQTFCTTTDSSQRVTDSMNVNTPLGRWFPVPRTTWFPAYRDHHNLYYRGDDDSLLVLTQAKLPGLYSFSHMIDILPLDCHPISCQHVGDSLWTHRKYRPAKVEHLFLPPGYLIESTFQDTQTQQIIIGSDGSLQQLRGFATCAWMIHSGSDQTIRACLLLADITSLSSYRCELEGIYRGLLHTTFLGLQPRAILQWCNNEAAVDKSNNAYWTLGDMLCPETDILLAIQHLRATLLPTTLTCRHIYGHKDTRSRPGPLQTSDSSASGDSMSSMGTHPTTPTTRQTPHSIPVQINIECDRIATEMATIVMSHQKHHILLAHRLSTLKQYCCKKYNWLHPTFDGVNWPAIRTVRRRLSKTQQMQTAKIMHGWLPVMHMLSHMTGNSQCPGCPHPDETLDHLFRCPNIVMRKRRDTLLLDLRTSGRKQGWPRPILEALWTIIHDFCEGQATTLPQHPQIREAVTAQLDIGINLLPRGFLSTRWLYLLEEFGVERPQSKITLFLHTLWFSFTLPLWQTRNDIVHRQENLHRQANLLNNCAQLRWFLDNPHVLSTSDHFLLRYSNEDIDHMTDRAQTHTLYHLEAARESNSLDLLNRQKGQHTITKFFKRVVDII